MKVAYFAHAANLTGADRSLIDLIVSIREKGVVPIVFLPKRGLIEEELNSNGIKYYILPYKRWYHDMRMKLTLNKRIRYFLKEIYNSFLAIRAAKLLKDEKVELVHSNSTLIGLGAQAASLCRLPHVWHIREFVEEDHQVVFDNEKKAVASLKKATALIAISEVVALKFSKKLDRDIITIYNGVDVKKYSIPCKRLFLHPTTELMIAGRIVEGKGQMEAIKAVELLKERGYNIHLSIIGDGVGDGEVDKIEEYIKDHHLEDVAEHIPFQTDISEYSRLCDIQLVCSRSEAFGRVTVEGMLAHSLVIGADAGCTPYLLEDGVNGLLYTCGDPQSLADKIEWAITHKEEAQKIANAGYDHGKGFSIDSTAEKVYELYSKVLSDDKHNL